MKKKVKKVRKEMSNKTIMIMIILALLFLGFSLVISNSISKSTADKSVAFQNPPKNSQAGVILTINPPTSSQSGE